MDPFWIVLSTLPFVSAFIGWGTNRLAIHMLFHPREPRRVLGFTVQGLVPRRHTELAIRSGEIVSRELLQSHVLRDEIAKIDLVPLLDQSVTTLVWERLGPQLKAIPFLGGMVNDTLLAKLHTLAAEELRREVPNLKAKVAEYAENEIDIERIVRERVDTFELEKLEEVVRNLADREFRQIEILGAVLGFAIGLVQALLMVAAQLMR
ncbi:MAG: DUF445 domain-containing protein [Verrucomicrobiota bacterium]